MDDRQVLLESSYNPAPCARDVLPMSAVLNTYLTEVRANLRLALPLIAAQLSFVSAGTVDAIFAGRLGAKELAAVAVGSNIWFMLFVMFMGLSMAVAPIVAHRIGAQQDAAKIGSFLRGALIMAVLLGLLWTVLMWALSAAALSLLNLDPVTNLFARDYLAAMAWTGLPFSLFFFLRNGAEGHGLIRVTLSAGLVGLAVNAGFDWLLMYGRWGFPPMGPEGCGWATVLSGWSMVAVALLQYRRTPILRALAITSQGWPPQIHSQHIEVLRLGLPIAAMFAAEAWLFCIGSLLMARFGADAIAAHQIAVNFAALCFMVPTAIGMATAVRVGHAAGAGESAAAALRGRTGIFIGVVFAGFSASLMTLAPGAIVAIYTDVEKLSSPAIQFLAYAALFQLFDCVQATSNGALRGVKDTLKPMLITVMAYWLAGMPLAVGLAFGLGVGPTGIWWGFILGLGVAAFGLSLRFFLRGQGLAIRALRAQDGPLNI